MFFFFFFFLIRCSIKSVLLDFNLKFPEGIQDKLNRCVCLPSDQIPHDFTPLKFPLLAREYQCVQLSQNMFLSDLTILVHDLTSFLHPLMGDLHILAFFHERPKALMFNTYLRSYAKKERQRVETKLKDDIKFCDEYNYLGAFFNALQTSISLVKRIVSGEATYGETVINHQLDLSAIDIDAEFCALSECQRFSSDNNTGQLGLKCMLKLMQFETKYYDLIVNVCKQYDLQGCLHDPELKQIEEVVFSVRDKETFHQLRAAIALEKWSIIENILKLKDRRIDGLQLFEKIADCVEFYQFLKERNFVGPNSAEIFRNQLRLIGQQIENDMTDHDMMVMEHLYSSISFIAPFLDRNQPFGKLMGCVSALDTTTGLSQLDTVRSKMHLIHIWFSKSQVTTTNHLI